MRDELILPNPSPATDPSSEVNTSLDPGAAGSLDAALSGSGGIPGIGAPQNDSYSINDGVDVGFPSYVDFVLPSNMVKFLSLKLSIKLRNFRAYANTNVTGNTGASTGHSHSHSHGGESGHSHSHSHTWHIQLNINATPNIGNNGSGIIQSTVSVDDIPTTTNAAGSSGHTHGSDATGESGHTHSLSVGLTGAIIETTLPQNVTVMLDGTDLTAKVGGPFNTDQVELDLTVFLNPTVGVWHTIQLGTARQGRLMGMLRVTYVANPLRP